MSLEVRITQRIAAPIDAVFEAFVDPAQMSGYFISSGSGRLEAGQTVTWAFADQGGVELEVEVKRVEPPESLAFVWSASGEPREVRLALCAESPGVTEISVCEGPFDLAPDSVARFGEQTQGWTHMLTCLKAYLEYYKVNLRSVPVGMYGLVVERAAEATPAELFAAWTTRWDEWFALKGTVAMRAVVNEPYRFQSDGGDGRQYPHYGRFLQIEPDRLVELAWVSVATRGIETVVKVEFTAIDATHTQVRLAHDGFCDEALAKGHEAAWPEILEHLEGCLRSRA